MQYIPLYLTSLTNNYCFSFLLILNSSTEPNLQTSAYCSQYNKRKSVHSKMHYHSFDSWSIKLKLIQFIYDNCHFWKLKFFLKSTNLPHRILKRFQMFTIYDYFRLCKKIETFGIWRDLRNNLCKIYCE